jgi:hypothetical protein
LRREGGLGGQRYNEVLTVIHQYYKSIDMGLCSSHVAFSDESCYNIGRFRSIALLTCSVDKHQEISEAYSQEILNSTVKEVKWENVRQARDRFAALAFLNLTIKYTIAQQIRIDVLIWDTKDSRHAVRGRDDIANLQRMYYHIFKNVFLNRWPTGASWDLYPDEQSAIDWIAVADYLEMKSVSVKALPMTLLNQGEPFRLRMERDFGVKSIQQVTSHTQPLCQVADLFAGIAAFSYDQFPKYKNWNDRTTRQASFEFEATPETMFSNSERERFAILQCFINSCQNRKMGIGLESSKGLKTFKPTNSINFWLYTPQADYDKAPIRVTMNP